MGPGYYILASGNRVFADPFSLIGGISASSRSLDLIKFAADYGIKPVFLKTAKNKIRVNPFLELTPENKAWVQQLLEDRIKVIKGYVIEHRGHRIPREAAQENLALSGDVFMGDTAVKLGLVDSLSCFRKIYDKEYYDCRIIEAKQTGASGKGNKAHRTLLWGNGVSSEEILEIVDELPGKLISNRLSFNFFA